MSRLLLTLIAAILCLPEASSGAEKVDETFFEERIRPVLVEYCYECHSGQSKKLKGRFRLDTALNLQQGGETGPAIDKADPSKSLLLKVIEYQDADLSMPPKGKLPPTELQELRKWILAGAPYPKSESPSSTPYAG